MATAASAPGQNLLDPKDIVLKRYSELIGYYWAKSKYNKRSYKTTRYLTIVLGALVTLISSLQSAEFVKAASLGTVFAVLTPVLAASMAIVGGISQAFQWGAAWSDMSITAARLEKERDRIEVTKEIDAVKEMAILDGLVVGETEEFFQRLFGSGGPGKAGPS